MKATQISETPIVLNTIEEAIEDIRNGKVIIVVDDEDRENEGRFCCCRRKNHSRDYQLYGYSWKRPYMYSTY